VGCIASRRGTLIPISIRVYSLVIFSSSSSHDRALCSSSYATIGICFIPRNSNICYARASLFTLSVRLIQLRASIEHLLNSNNEHTRALLLLLLLTLFASLFMRLHFYGHTTHLFLFRIRSVTRKSILELINSYFH